MDADDTRQVLAAAVDLADQLPEAYRSLGFVKAVELLTSQEGETPSATPLARRKGARSAKGASQVGKSGASQASSGRRPGALKLARDLLTSGYFDEPRNPGDVQEHLQRSRGFKLDTSDISDKLLRLVRKNELERDTDEKGNYRYFKKSTR